MADLKPIGSEKLTGQDKLKRIMEIARFKETIPSLANETSRTEYSVSLADGNDYQIVKERQGYIIKKVVSESQTDYIEPMKNRKYYSSYSQAFKRLNLIAGEMNRLNENEEGVSLYGEQKKFVLKTPKPAPEPEMELPAAPPAAPPPVPSPELPPSPVGEVPPVEGGEDLGGEEGGVEGDLDSLDMGGEDMGGEDAMPSDTEEQVTFKTIQKLTGKLTQKIRTLDNEQGMTSEDIKYVINMVLSSLDLASLSEEDKDDIMLKFEEAEGREEGGEDLGDEDLSSDELGGDEMSMGAETEEPVGGEMEESGYGAIIDHIFSESKVDKVISKYFEVTKKEILENRNKNLEKESKRIIDLKKQMNEVIKLTESIEQELASKKFLEENSSAKIVGKTNKKNLVFENKGEQIKITPEGLLL